MGATTSRCGGKPPFGSVWVGSMAFNTDTPVPADRGNVASGGALWFNTDTAVPAERGNVASAGALRFNTDTAVPADRRTGAVMTDGMLEGSLGRESNSTSSVSR